ncbi:MAG TPA: cupin domain-containing protein [Paraburkholderia sp.]|jgi:cupin 2 domain-containing protein|nr:cupin domain-containing protein [Paraburkholderia sp.]
MNTSRVTVGGNLYANLAPDAAAERFERLIDRQGVTIERIVSMGQASPDGFWYDDPRDEWVVLLTGAAALQFEGAAGERRLAPGDYVHIPAHCRHRVAWTDAEAPTVWLAVYLPAAADR